MHHRLDHLLHSGKKKIKQPNGQIIYGEMPMTLSNTEPCFAGFYFKIKEQYIAGLFQINETYYGLSSFK